MSAPSEAGARQPDNPARPKANHRVGMELCVQGGNELHEAIGKEDVGQEQVKVFSPEIFNNAQGQGNKCRTQSRLTHLRGLRWNYIRKRRAELALASMKNRTLHGKSGAPTPLIFWDSRTIAGKAGKGSQQEIQSKPKEGNHIMSTQHNSLSTEVQMQFVRPAQLEAALRKFPVVYVPFGLIEWHSRHLPLGNDALKAHAILVKCASEFGGVVYPPQWLHSGFNQEHLVPVYSQLFERLKRTGVRVIIGISGHGVPEQIEMINQALKPVVADGTITGIGLCDTTLTNIEWRKKHHEDIPTMRKKAKYLPDGRLLLDGKETLIQRDAECAGDHAAKWETSNMLYLYPELVDMNELGTEPFPLDMSPPMGIGGLDPRKYSSVEIGCRTVKLCAEAIGRKARELLESLPENQRAFNLPALIPGHWWCI